MHAALPKKFSIAMWEAYLQSLSEDDCIWHIGIPMVSQCECCEDGTLEELNHVLYGGRMASMLWKTCSLFLGIPYVENCSWAESVEAWFRRAKKVSQVWNLNGRLVPVVLTWSLWSRC